MIIALASLLQVIVLLASCSHSPVVSERSGAVTGDPDSQFPIVTDRSKVILRRGAYAYLEGTIGYRFTNRMAITVYVPVCHAPFPPALQKYEDNQWILGYSRPVSLCLGTPLEIPPGETITLTYQIIHGLPGSNLGRMFRVSEINGTFRMVWNVYRNRDELGRTWDLLPLELRISNPFAIEIESHP